MRCVLGVIGGDNGNQGRGACLESSNEYRLGPAMPGAIWRQIPVGLIGKSQSQDTWVHVSFDDEFRVDPFDEIHLLSHEFVLEPPHPFLDES